MNCAGVERCLDAFVDREIEVLARVEVERHLVTCEACSQRVAFALWLKRSLKQEAQVQAPDELKARLQVALREEEAPTFRRVDASWRSTARSSSRRAGPGSTPRASTNVSRAAR